MVNMVFWGKYCNYTRTSMDILSYNTYPPSIVLYFWGK
jgi:hypothetical protein